MTRIAEAQITPEMTQALDSLFNANTSTSLAQIEQQQLNELFNTLTEKSSEPKNDSFVNTNKQQTVTDEPIGVSALKASPIGQFITQGAKVLPEVNEIYNDVAIVPGSAVRGGIQSALRWENFVEGYAKGANAPEKTPLFQKQMLDNYYKKTDEVIRKVDNPTMKNLVTKLRDGYGFGVSALGTIADMATNPFDLLTELSSAGMGKLLRGLKPSQQKALVQVVKSSDDLKQNQKFMDTVVDGIEKAARIGVRGRQTTQKFVKSKENIAIAVDSILDNAENIKYADNTGTVIGTGTPQSMEEFIQAIDQTKNSLYKEWTSLRKQADAGMKAGVIKSRGVLTKTDDVLVDLKPIARELKQSMMADSRIYNSRQYSGLRKSIEDVVSDLETWDSMPLGEAEKYLEMLNTELRGSYARGSSGILDDVNKYVAYQLRERMDDIITNQAGEGFRELRRRYGALKSIEKDAVNRTIVNARRNPKGFFDVVDAWNYGQVARGLLTFNPGAVAQGVVGSVVKSVIKSKNNPNQILANTFKKAAQIKFSKPRSVSIPSNTLTDLLIGSTPQNIRNTAGITTGTKQ